MITKKEFSQALTDNASVAAGLIPLATNDNDGLMSANDKSVFPFLGQSKNLIQVTKSFYINYVRTVVRITGFLGVMTSSIIDAILIIYTDPELGEKNNLVLKFISGKKTTYFKIFEKDKFIYLQIGNRSNPFVGIITSTRYIKDLGVEPDDTYTEVTPTILT